MKIIVTGAAGRLGSEVLSRLAQAGHETKGIDLSPRSESGQRVEVCNLLDREACYRFLEGAEAVVHLGNHSRADEDEAQRIFSENCAMNMNVFQASAELGVKKIIFASSIQVVAGNHYMGDGKPSSLPYLPMDGDLPPNPGNSYALSKQTAENMLCYYARQKGMETVALRFPWLRNPRWNWHGMFQYKGMTEHHRYHLHPDEGFCILNMGDATDLVARIVERPMPGYRCYQPAANEMQFTDVTVAEIIQDFFCTVPLRKPVESMTSLCDISRITAETGWQPNSIIR